MRRFTSARRGRRGSAVVLSLLVILAMSGLGIVAINAAIFASRSAVYTRTTKQSQYAAEVAMLAGTVHLAEAAQRYAMAKVNIPFIFESSQRVGPLPGSGDGSGDPYFGNEPYGTLPLTPSFLVSYRFLGDSGRKVPGNSGKQCFQTVRMTGQGVVTDPGAAGTVDDVAYDGLQSVRRLSANHIVGPLPCASR